LLIVFASITSAYHTIAQSSINWRAVLIIGFSSALTALARTICCRLKEDTSSDLCSDCDLAAIRMLTERQIHAQKRRKHPLTQGLSACRIGFATGIVSALGGVGGELSLF